MLACCDVPPGDLTATAVASTGDCNCFVGTSQTLTRFASGGGFAWSNSSTFTGYKPCNYPILLQIKCDPTNPVTLPTGEQDAWSGEGSASVGGSPTLIVHSCNPFMATLRLVFNNYIPGGPNCVGTVTYEITG